MFRKPNFLLLTVLWSLLTIVIVLLDAPSEIRLIPGLGLIFILPGYSLTVALFPDRHFELPQGMLLALGLSLAISIVSGLALNATPDGLTATNWALWLGAITIGSALVARLRLDPAHIYIPAGHFARPQAWQIAIVLLALVVGSAAILINDQSALRLWQNADATQLWILPTADKPSSFQIGVRNSEAGPAAYKLQLIQVGKIVMEWNSIELAANATWKQTETLSTEQLAANQLEVVLYQANDPRVTFRRVVWILNPAVVQRF